MLEISIEFESVIGVGLEPNIMMDGQVVGVLVLTNDRERGYRVCYNDTASVTL